MGKEREEQNRAEVYFAPSFISFFVVSNCRQSKNSIALVVTLSHSKVKSLKISQEALNGPFNGSLNHSGNSIRIQSQKSTTLRETRKDRKRKKVE